MTLSPSSAPAGVAKKGALQQDTNMKLYIDIETVPDQREGALDKYLAEVKPPANYKKPESIEKWMKENAEMVAVEQWKKSALTGIAGEILSVAWAFDDRPSEGVCRALDEDERVAIGGLFAAIKREMRAGQGGFPKLEWIGHNLIEFDLRFLWQRCVILEFEPPVQIPVESRHDKGRVYDTMKAWAGWKGYEKQDNIIAALDPDYPAPEIDGSMVWDMAQAGLYDDILAYNKSDVEKVRTMHRRMTWAR